MKNLLTNILIFFDASHVFSLFIILSAMFIFFAGLILSNKKKTMKEERFRIYKSVYISIVIILVFSIFYLSLRIYFPNYVKYPHINKLMLVFLTLSVGIFLYRMSILITLFIKLTVTKTLNREIDDIVFKWSDIALKVIVSIVIFFIVLKIYNVDITTLVAGLGIGGIAVALAAQDSISNVLGCAIIILDKPFIIGDRIKLLDYDGTIETVGLRSIRIRTFDGSIIVVPNKTVANANIENITSRTSIRQTEEINIEPRLNNNELESLILGIKEILKENNKIKNDYVVFFDKRDAISITIKITYYIETTEYSEYVLIKEVVNYEIYALLSKKNVSYAHPSSLVYVSNK